MDFQHSGEIWRDFPELVPGIVFANGITRDVTASDRIARFTALARSRLAGGSESELPEVQAWRRAFTRMGLKPTQYRCASEALLRRFRKEGTLLQLHPLVDVCNAVSLAFAIPVAVFDVSKITGRLEVRYAAGDEDYLTFSGQAEHPSPMHDSAPTDVPELIAAITGELNAIWAITPAATVLSQAAPRFTLPG
jgi:DNA/RNA-binding domain of Phe-tRNA-synthetase-like protein